MGRSAELATARKIERLLADYFNHLGLDCPQAHGSHYIAVGHVEHETGGDVDRLVSDDNVMFVSLADIAEHLVREIG